MQEELFNLLTRFFYVKYHFFGIGESLANDTTCHILNNVQGINNGKGNLFRINPITAKRLKRFRAHRRAFFSLVALLCLYALSLCSELLCNDVPILVWHNGRLFLPILRFYPDDAFTGSGVNTRADYFAISRRSEFADGPSWMLWPLMKTGPNAIAKAEDLSENLRIVCTLAPVPQVCGISLDGEMNIIRLQGAENLRLSEDEWNGKKLGDFWTVPSELQAGVQSRIGNKTSAAATFQCDGRNGMPNASISLAAFNERKRPPREVRATVRFGVGDAKQHILSFPKGSSLPATDVDFFSRLPDDIKAAIAKAAMEATANGESSGEIAIGDAPYRLTAEQETLRFPFRPVHGHPFGFDAAGRDVLVRLLYALRTSLSFGIILVCCSMLVGSLIGLTQGYLGGWVDLGGQRLIEIWSALPFLYIIILMGSIYGPGFWLMIFCYALFNWIGISYYMRAEMLRLRKLPFVESAKCMGLSSVRIVLRHVLPNALVPIITFFPFSLVGAIGSLAALDYLGFGLPPPTPSIGQLLQQAQSMRWAWWLILYPSLLLFVVMMLGVFIGEGVRDAFDPRTQGRLE